MAWTDANPYMTPGAGGPTPGNPGTPSWYQQHSRELDAYGEGARGSNQQGSSAPARGRESGNNFGALDIGAWGRGGLMAAGVLGIPGTGIIGGALNANNVMANNSGRAAVGMDGLNFGQMLGGVLGVNSYGRGLTPSVQQANQMLNEYTTINPATIPQAAFSSPYGGTASMDFFGGLNDLSTVGNFGSTMDALDAARNGGFGGGFSGGDGVSSGSSDGWSGGGSGGASP